MFIITILAFIVGAVATYLVVVVGFTVAWDIMGVHDQDGGGAMALGLVIGPACAVIGGLICAIFVSMWVAKRRDLAGPTTTEERRRDVRRFFITGGTLGAGYIGYELALLIYW